jgi:hypothetical protein
VEVVDVLCAVTVIFFTRSCRGCVDGESWYEIGESDRCLPTPEEPSLGSSPCAPPATMAGEEDDEDDEDDDSGIEIRGAFPFACVVMFS